MHCCSFPVRRLLCSTRCFSRGKSVLGQSFPSYCSPIQAQNAYCRMTPLSSSRTRFLTTALFQWNIRISRGTCVNVLYVNALLQHAHSHSVPPVFLYTARHTDASYKHTRMLDHASMLLVRFLVDFKWLFGSFTYMMWRGSCWLSNMSNQKFDYFCQVGEEMGFRARFWMAYLKIKRYVWWCCRCHMFFSIASTHTMTRHILMSSQTHRCNVHTRCRALGVCCLLDSLWTFSDFLGALLCDWSAMSKGHTSWNLPILSPPRVNQFSCT
jgi:hypothetical protein